MLRSLAPLLLALTLTGCGQEDALRFAGIPDADKETLTRQYEVVTRYLEEQLGRPVEYVHVADYTGAVTALAANKLDLVWLGGVTAVQAEERTGGQVEFIASRASDLRFKTYFIASRKHLESGLLPAAGDHEPMPVDALAEMKVALGDLSFTFGSKSSTSGHVMPRHFMALAGINPEVDFAGKAAFQLQGGHSATLAQVATGAVDVGALNYATWEQADETTRAAAPVIYVTPHYVDYCMVAHARLGPELVAKLRGAFAALDGSDPAHAPVLEAFAAKRFVPADSQSWDDIRAVLAAARERGILE